MRTGSVLLLLGSAILQVVANTCGGLTQGSHPAYPSLSSVTTDAVNNKIKLTFDVSRYYDNVQFAFTGTGVSLNAATWCNFAFAPDRAVGGADASVPGTTVATVSVHPTNAATIHWTLTYGSTGTTSGCEADTYVWAADYDATLMHCFPSGTFDSMTDTQTLDASIAITTTQSLYFEPDPALTNTARVETTDVVAQYVFNSAVTASVTPPLTVNSVQYATITSATLDPVNSQITVLLTTQLDYPNQLTATGTTFFLGSGYSQATLTETTGSACGSMYTVCRQTWSLVLDLTRTCSSVTSAQALLAANGGFDITWAQGCAVMNGCTDTVPDFVAALSSDNTCGTLSTQTTTLPLTTAVDAWTNVGHTTPASPNNINWGDTTYFRSYVSLNALVLTLNSGAFASVVLTIHDSSPTPAVATTWAIGSVPMQVVLDPAPSAPYDVNNAFTFSIQWDANALGLGGFTGHYAGATVQVAVTLSFLVGQSTHNVLLSTALAAPVNQAPRSLALLQNAVNVLGKKHLVQTLQGTATARTNVVMSGGSTAQSSKSSSSIFSNPAVTASVAAGCASVAIAGVLAVIAVKMLMAKSAAAAVAKSSACLSSSSADSTSATEIAVEIPVQSLETPMIV